MTRRTIAIPFACLCLAALTVACNDDDKPVRPGLTALNLSNAWPSEDGRFWTYSMTQREWADGGVVFVENPPPTPSFDEVAKLLGNHPVGENPTSALGAYKLEFDGTITTQSGAVGQNLRETLTPADPVLSLRSAQSGAREFFARLAAARPDLVARYPQLHSARRAESPGLGPLWMPLLIHGYAWEKTPSWIGTYGDLDQELAWKFLEDNLELGHEYVFQLIPSIADDVFLHARVIDRTNVELSGISRTRAVEVLYMVDYGVSMGSGPTGEPTGYARWIDYGTVTYAAEIGPISCYERKLISVSDELGPGIGEVRLSLTETGGPGDRPPLSAIH